MIGIKRIYSRFVWSFFYIRHAVPKLLRSWIADYDIFPSFTEILVADPNIISLALGICFFRLDRRLPTQIRFADYFSNRLLRIGFPKAIIGYQMPSIRPSKTRKTVPT